MSEGDTAADNIVHVSPSGETAPTTEKPRIDLDRVHRSFASLIRQGVIVPNSGGYNPRGVQAEFPGDGDLRQ